MNSPNVRSTKDIIVRNTYVTGEDDQEMKRAENCILFIENCTQGIENIHHYISDLDHKGIGNTICELKPTIMSMGYAPLYSSAVALENEFLKQIIAYPRPNLEDFIDQITVAISNANNQLQGLRVSLI